VAVGHDFSVGSQEQGKLKMGAGRKGLLQQEQADTSPVVADEVKHTTCYMCACRCGIRVHLKDGKVRYIEGNPDQRVRPASCSIIRRHG
jgi:anaerobic selenocysteine-containing dehydrogenase